MARDQSFQLSNFQRFRREIWLVYRDSVDIVRYMNMLIVRFTLVFGTAAAILAVVTGHYSRILKIAGVVGVLGLISGIDYVFHRVGLYDRLKWWTG